MTCQRNRPLKKLVSDSRQEIPEVLIEFNHHHEPWPKKSLYMVTPIFGGIILTDTKVSSVLGVISEIKKKNPRVVVEKDLKSRVQK